MLNGKRLAAARKRRKLTAKKLAEQSGLSPVTITRLEKGPSSADSTTVEKLSLALGYPVEYFALDDPPSISSEMVSFRSLSNISAKERDAAISAGDNGVELFQWAESLFDLPTPLIPNLCPESEASPESAAEILRGVWSLGDRPISHLIKLLESKGVRILGLAEDTTNVDAFSFWFEGVPYMFLNSLKSAERSLFDAAHELGHLTMHRHGATNSDRNVENEANAFASAFLMPRSDVLAQAPRYIGIKEILRLKSRWKVSAMALAYRLRQLDFLTEWNHRSICIELGRLGYRSGEPQGIPRERSTVWSQILADMWSNRKNKQDIANAINLPVDEVDALLQGIMDSTERVTRPVKLKLVP